jgi:serine/threonine protein kinase
MGVFSNIKQFLNRTLPKGHVDIEKRFELSSTAGQGSMSKVYWASDRQLGRMICLKILDKEITARFEGRFKGLHRPTEGAIAQGLQHRNIVKTLEHGLTTTGQNYIVMEMIEGTRLDVLIQSKSERLKGNRINYLLQISEGLEYIHQQKFAHQDICPRNVMIDHQGVAKIIDFGLSVPLRPEFCKLHSRTVLPTEIGPDSLKPVTPYVDPVLFKMGILDQRLDLFALGVTVYQTLTGSLPWEKVDTGRALTWSVRDPRRIMPRMDDKTASYLEKAIHSEPASRFHSVKEMKEALKTLPVV